MYQCSFALKDLLIKISLKNAGNSLENAVFIKDEDVDKAYFDEYVTLRTNEFENDIFVINQ